MCMYINRLLFISIDTETLESKLAKLLEIVSKHSTFQKEKSSRFFENYTEAFRKKRTAWQKSIECDSTPGSKPYSSKGASSLNEGLTQRQATTEEPPQPKSSTMSRKYRSFE